MAGRSTERSTLCNMNAPMNDSHKRTSISQLLNPLGAVSEQPMSRTPTIPSSMPSAPSQNGQDVQQDGSSLHSPGSSFQLRSASWEQGGGDGQSPSKRPDGPDPSRPYHYTPFTDGYGLDARTVRPSAPSGPWPASHEVPNMPYGTPVIAPMYSDERTG